MGEKMAGTNEFALLFLGYILKATHIQKAPSPELWLMWGTFAGTLVNATEVLVNGVLWVRQSSPDFAKVRQSSHEGARILLVHTLELA